jgi:hypothetical protein
MLLFEKTCAAKETRLTKSPLIGGGRNTVNNTTHVYCKIQHSAYSAKDGFMISNESTGKSQPTMDSWKHDKESSSSTKDS